MQFQHAPVDDERLSDNRLISLMIDLQENLWMGTMGHGLNRYEPKTGIFTTYINGTNGMTSLIDREGRFWAGGNEGLFQLDLENRQHVHYTTENGIPNRSLIGIIEDKQGFIWLATAGGVA